MVDQDTSGEGNTTLAADKGLPPKAGSRQGAGVDVTAARSPYAPARTPVRAPEVATQPRPGSSDEAFREFFRQTYRILIKQARYAGANDHEADDATAATMADVFENWRRLDDPVAWARRAVVRFYVKAKTRNLDRSGHDRSVMGSLPRTAAPIQT